MELYKIKLTNGTEVYGIGSDEFEAKDKVMDWVKERFFQSVQIGSMELVAESATKGNVPKLVN
jgi:hypothetical protein